MRTTLTFSFVALLTLTACQGGISGPADSACCEEPTCGQVLTTCDSAGSIVVSLGSKDGVRPGDTLVITRNGTNVGTIVIHAVNENQAAGSAFGRSSGGVRPGDTVMASD